MTAISPYISQINQLCRQNGVKELYAFGSILIREFKSESDVDLLVDFLQLSPSEYAKNYYSLKFSLEKLFGRNVDLLEVRSLKNPFLSQEINKTKHLLYAA
jgi:predicted nucleotidyltransferase